jgi:hypothetical protein
MKSLEFYKKELGKAQKKAKRLERFLKRSRKTLVFQEQIKQARQELSETLELIQGYRAIVASIETGIPLGRYHDHLIAFRILNNENKEKRRSDNG